MILFLRKVNTKFGNQVSSKLDDEEKGYYLAKKYGELSHHVYYHSINKINKGKHKFNYFGYIDVKNEYKLEHVL